MKDGTIGSYTKEKYNNPKMEYWLSQSKFCNEFSLSVFRNKIQQEQQTAKYYHTPTVQGKRKHTNTAINLPLLLLPRTNNCIRR